MNNKKIPVLIYTFISVFYIELIFRAVTTEKFFTSSLLFILLSSVMVSFVITLLVKLFKGKGAKILYFILMFLVTFWAIFEIVYKNTLNVYFSLSMLKLADQVMTFWEDALLMAWSNIIYILLLFIPFIVLIIINKKINYNKFSLGKYGIFFGIFVFVIGLFNLSLLFNKKQAYSAYNLFYRVNDTSLSIEKFGVNLGGFLDIFKNVTGFEENIILVNDSDDEENKEAEKEYGYNIDESINFDSLISNESNNTLKNMHEYFNSDNGTLQNEYTGYFKGKNLILFMAESFNEIAVDEKHTPTLYKLTTNGFVFKNFYTPVNNSTIGGEFQMLSGLFANGQLSTWRSGKNTFPYGIATLFQNEGYSTYAYHDHFYKFQDRNKYLASLGFTNFKGCGNGLGDLINCNTWPESDVEMIEKTFDDYINQDQFMVFYASVSGHGGYSWSGNAQSSKHRNEVSDLNYSEPVRAYIAAQMEFDKALELLINKLEASGKLKDTVIAFVGDHYPYMLSLDQVNEAASYKKDNVIEINHSNFAVWNSEMEKINIDKVGSQIDVLPTIYNLFGLKYDSRLIVGKDILSTAPGLAIFSNRSWVTDSGKYFANTKKFVANDGVSVDDDYVANMNNIVSSKITMSKNIVQYNYYSKIK